MSYRKGEIMQTSSGRAVTQRTGMWLIKADDALPEDVNSQVADLFGHLTTDVSVWRSLAEQHEVDLFCGLFMDETNEAFSLSTDTLAGLATRGIEIGFDILRSYRRT